MLLCWHQLSSCLVLLWLCSSSSNALCPSNCTCKLTEKGRRKVVCTMGGMHDPIPTLEMDPDMEILDISAPESNWNSLTITPIFQPFKKLEELHIRKSSIQQIAMHAFWGVPSLKLLDLTFNNISGVLDHNFRGLANLVELNLDDNCIKKLPGGGVFKHLTELRILTLQRNLLRELVPRLFLKLGKLHVLKLSGNKIEELDPEVFKDIPELRVLECRACGIRRINTQIYHLLPYLSHLDLGNNQMQFLAADEFVDLRKLHSLKLDGNLLPVVLEKTFVRQQQLKYLCLARNRLAKITNTAFLNMTGLVDLDISYNKLDKIEIVALQHVSETLQRLVISGNAFSVSVIKDILQTVYKVWSFDMAQMKIKELPDGFFPDRIRKLNVSWNNITDLGMKVLPKQLTDLDLSGNKLKGLDERLIFKLEDLKHVNLSNNPWSCSLCRIAPVIFRVNRTALFKDLRCASPRHLKGRGLPSLRLEELTACKDDERNDEENDIAPPSSDNKLSLVVGITSLLVFLAVCVIFVVCSCTRRRAQAAIQEQKRLTEQRRRDLTALDGPTAIFCKGEISFKFPLDLTERRVSVSTIDEMKKDTQLQRLPNGTGI